MQGMNQTQSLTKYFIPGLAGVKQPSCSRIILVKQWDPPSWKLPLFLRRWRCMKHQHYWAVYSCILAWNETLIIHVWLSFLLYYALLVGGLEHLFFFLMLGITIPNDFHIFQRGRSTTKQFMCNYLCWLD